MSLWNTSSVAKFAIDTEGAGFRNLWQFVKVKNKELWHGNIYHIGEYVFWDFLCS